MPSSRPVISCHELQSDLFSARIIISSFIYLPVYCTVLCRVARSGTKPSFISIHLCSNSSRLFPGCGTGAVGNCLVLEMRECGVCQKMAAHGWDEGL